MRLRRRRKRAGSTSLLADFTERLVGKGELLITAGDALPLVVASYPRGRAWFASSLADVLRFTFPSLPVAVRATYSEILSKLPAVVVADLRRHNVCTCLGHHHPEPTHGLLSRRIAADTNGGIGEIDLAVESIRAWNPLPLAGLAAACNQDLERLSDDVRFRAALLSVFLHELEHVAFPNRPEPEIRRRSNGFFVDAVAAQIGCEFGLTPSAASFSFETAH